MHTTSHKLTAGAKATRFLVILAVASGLLLVGCDSSGGDDPEPTVTGNYSATLNVNGNAADFDVSLSENDDGEVNGNGTIGGSSGSIALTVDGTHNHPNISLTFSSSGFRDFNLSGDVSDNGDRISGELNGSDLGGTDVTLVRD